MSQRLALTHTPVHLQHLMHFMFSSLFENNNKQTKVHGGRLAETDNVALEM